MTYSDHCFFNPYFLTAAGRTCRQVSCVVGFRGAVELLADRLYVGRFEGESDGEPAGKLLEKVAEKSGVDAICMPLTSSLDNGLASDTVAFLLALLADLGVNISGEDSSRKCSLPEYAVVGVGVELPHSRLRFTFVSTESVGP